ncbi:hypothetical protein [Enemella sp. A6]|uniref:hypothetical protein n=1 Tax=Enemella sp. A6 TaxID=3440152 RepID=UPI003EB733A5
MAANDGRVEQTIAAVATKTELTDTERATLRRAVPKLDELTDAQGYLLEPDRLELLALHVVTVLRRVAADQPLEPFDEAMFDQVSPQSMELAHELLAAVEPGATQREEDFLIAVHLDTAKLLERNEL